jgi:PTS system mannose-specific IIB component
MGMDIRLARIDDRLIHGQVATAWSRMTDIERIIVVSDEVANDKLRKVLLRQAAPTGIDSNVVSIEKMIAIYHNPLFDGMKVLLLFTNPQDIVRLVMAGVEITSVNIGGMRFTNGKRMITNFVSVNSDDVNAFEILNQLNIELEIRKVPTDRKVLLMELLKKEKLR